MCHVDVLLVSGREGPGGSASLSSGSTRISSLTSIMRCGAMGSIETLGARNKTQQKSNECEPRVLFNYWQRQQFVKKMQFEAKNLGFSESNADKKGIVLRYEISRG